MQQPHPLTCSTHFWHQLTAACISSEVPHAYMACLITWGGGDTMGRQHQHSQQPQQQQNRNDISGSSACGQKKPQASNLQRPSR